MTAILKLDSKLKDRLWGHLLPKTSAVEQAAFLFCAHSENQNCLEFRVVESAFLSSNDFSAQYGDYLELGDQARTSLIKRAHELDACLAEFHSHPRPWPAAFSYSDHVGLRQTVPHMHWRLSRRPYVAVVVAPSGFDALVWRHGKVGPDPMIGIEVHQSVFKPTNISIREYYAHD